MITTKEANDILIKLEFDLREAITQKIKSLVPVIQEESGEPIQEIRFKEIDQFAPDKDERETIMGIYCESSCDGSSILVISKDYEDDEIPYDLASAIWTASDLIQLLETINKY